MSFCPLIKEECKKNGCDWYNTGDSAIKDYSACSIIVLASNTSIIMDTLNEIHKKVTK